jgi:hypothetical protein
MKWDMEKDEHQGMRYPLHDELHDVFMRPCDEI